MWSKTWRGTASLTPEQPLAAILSAAKTTTCRPLQGVGPDQATRTCQEAHALSIVLMSSTGYSSIGMLASRARLRFTGSTRIIQLLKWVEGFIIER